MKNIINKVNFIILIFFLLLNTSCSTQNISNKNIKYAIKKDTIYFNLPEIIYKYDTVLINTKTDTLTSINSKNLLPKCFKNINEYKYFVLNRHTIPYHEDSYNGHIIVKFIVNNNGVISSTSIIKGINKYVNKEVKKLLKSLYKCQPAKNYKNTPIISIGYLSVYFDIELPKPKKDTPYTYDKID